MKRGCKQLLVLLYADTDIRSRTYGKRNLVTVARGSSPCGNEQLVSCAYPINKDIVFLTRKEELDTWCPSLKTGLRCIEGYARRCMTAPQRQHFLRLYAGTTMVIEELCQEGPYRQEFLRHAPCMREMRSHYEYCGKTYQKQMQQVSTNRTALQPDEDSQVRTVCCSFQDYLQCSQTIVKEKCGDETAKFTEGFLDRMASNLIKVHCEKHLTRGESCQDYFSSSLPSLPNGALILILASFLGAHTEQWQFM